MYYNWMVWCKTDLSDFSEWIFFPSRVPEFLHLLFNLVAKPSPVFCGWNALVPLCCVHCAHFDILPSFSHKQRANQPKKYRGIFCYLIQKRMQKFRHFWRKKIHPKKSLKSVLYQAIQLFESIFLSRVQGRWSRMIFYIKVIPLKLFYYQTFFETWHD